jgi:P27 family predicted phage terminase small subunit
MTMSAAQDKAKLHPINGDNKTDPLADPLLGLSGPQRESVRERAFLKAQAIVEAEELEKVRVARAIEIDAAMNEGRPFKPREQPPIRLRDYPDWFDEEQIKVWERVLDHDMPEGNLTYADYTLFTQFCVLSVVHDQLAEKVIDMDGELTIVDDKGNDKTSPVFLQYLSVASRLGALASKLGMDPSSLTKTQLARDNLRMLREADRVDPTKGEEDDDPFKGMPL